MDADERQARFEDSIRPFLQDPEDAVWFLKNYRQRVKDEYPDLELTQPTTTGELTTRVTNDTSKVEGNKWKIIKVNPSFLPPSDRLDRRWPKT